MHTESGCRKEIERQRHTHTHTGARVDDARKKRAKRDTILVSQLVSEAGSQTERQARGGTGTLTQDIRVCKKRERESQRKVPLFVLITDCTPNSGRRERETRVRCNVCSKILHRQHQHQKKMLRLYKRALQTHAAPDSILPLSDLLCCAQLLTTIHQGDMKRKKGSQTHAYCSLYVSVCV